MKWGNQERELRQEYKRKRGEQGRIGGEGGGRGWRGREEEDEGEDENEEEWEEEFWSNQFLTCYNDFYLFMYCQYSDMQ